VFHDKIGYVFVIIYLVRIMMNLEIIWRLVAIILALLLASCESTTPTTPDPSPSAPPAVEKPRGLTRIEPLALVIGNAKYEDKPLANSINDAKLIAKVLQEKGFKVTLKTDLKKAEMEQVIRDFSNQLEGNENISLFYFAGHGLQLDGSNYLVPINNRQLQDETDVQNDAIKLDEIVQRMGKAKDGLKVVIIDACRDNPFQPPMMARSRGTLTRGLARIDVQVQVPRTASKEMLVAFATQPGQTAADNGLYAAHLAQAIQTPGLKVEDVFKRVSKTVKEKTKGEQEPWYGTANIINDYCIGVCASAETPVNPPPVIPPLKPPVTPPANRPPTDSGNKPSTCESVKTEYNRCQSLPGCVVSAKLEASYRECLRKR
jgi:hypothetical protein